jgi:hypothetical protein
METVTRKNIFFTILVQWVCRKIQLLKYSCCVLYVIVVVQVMESMLSFFLSYLQLFVSFGIIFHILLPDSLVFNRLDNALVKGPDYQTNLMLSSF